MTHKEIAERGRGILDKPGWREDKIDAFKALFDELDPPKPEPDTVVWMCWSDIDGCDSVWLTNKEANAHAALNGELEVFEIHIPATVLQPGQVAVDVPFVGMWPFTVDRERAVRASLVWHFHDKNGACFNQMTAKHGSVTRTDAQELHHG